MTAHVATVAAALASALGSASVAAAAGVSAGGWPTRVRQRRGMLHQSLNRGRMPAIDYWVDAQDYARDGQDGGDAVASAMVSVWVAGLGQGAALAVAGEILGAALSELRTTVLGREGSSGATSWQWFGVAGKLSCPVEIRQRFLVVDHGGV